MFEKEAEEWVKNNLHSTEEDYIKAFKDGAEFGYNKGKEDVKKTILKLRNCMNCKHRDTRCFSSGEDKGVVLCNHWEMKE